MEVAEALNALTPGDHEKRSALFNSGAEAVENAVKIARACTGRTAVAVFDHAYHGRTNLTMAMTAKSMPYKHGFGPFAPEVYRAPMSYPFRDRRRSPAPRRPPGDRRPRQAGRRHEPGRVVIEPIQGEGGFIVPAAAASCPGCASGAGEHGIVFIADEVQTGFGRTGDWFACEHEGVVPDLVTTAKGIAGGFPLAAVTGRAEIMDAPTRRPRRHLRRQPGGLRRGARRHRDDGGARPRRPRARAIGESMARGCARSGGRTRASATSAAGAP